MATAKIVQSDKYSLSSYDWKSLFIGLGITLLGAGLTYLSEAIAKVDFGIYTPLIMTVWAFLINAIRKFIGESKYIAK
jgi:hypothetical protein